MLTITSSDLTLAAELGLLLVKQEEAESDRALGTDLRATRTPESWTVKEVLTKRPVGRIYFTATDSLYATKFAAGISGIEETVADALRWIAPFIRHARTGQYNGTEVVVRRYGSMFERPLAVTECGAKATGADYGPVAAKSAISNGEAGEMCPACRDKLEDRGVHDVSNLSDRRGSASPRQCAFIRYLLDEAASCGRPYLVDTHNLHQLSSREASRTIDALKSLKSRDWKGTL